MPTDLDSDENDVPFTVWRMGGLEADARAFRAATARQAAEQCAHAEYVEDPAWQHDHRVYYVRDGATGRFWTVTVGLVHEPSFVAVGAREIPMPSATHVLWGGRVLCEDLRLRGVPRDWPDGQRWISLKDVADGAAAPPDHCEACWTKAPGLVEGIRQIGVNR